MQTWRVSASFPGGAIGNPSGPPATQSLWVKGTSGGFVQPTLPAPSFQLTGFNVDEGARNDQQGRVATTSLPLNENPRDCPYTPMFFYDAAQAPVPAAGFYVDQAGQVQPDTDPAWAKYTILSNGHLYFRAPTFPALRYVTPPTYNSWVFVLNCRNEYSNAVRFRVYPTDLQLMSVTPGGFIGGQQVNLFGTGFAGITPNDQKVFFHVRLGRNNATNTALDYTTREIEAAPAFASQSSSPQVLDSRQINVLAPSLEGLGYGYTSGYVLVESSVYVTRGLAHTVSLPVRICSSTATAAKIAGTGPCWGP